MVHRSAVLLPLLLAVVGCAAPPPPSPPPPSAPMLPGLAPVSPAGTEGLRAAPCSRRLDLSASTAEPRAFNPGARSLSARTTLTFRARDPAAQWRWSASRPGALHFEEGPAGAVTLIAGEPGTTLARLVSDEPNGIEEASLLISVPMFVSVRADRDLAAVLERELGLRGRERELMTEARRVLDSIYARANLRVAFRVGLGEEVPPELPEGGFIVATLHGDLHRCVTPRSSLLSAEFGGYGEGDAAQRLVRAPVHVCPAIFLRHPDTMAAMVKARARLLAEPQSAALYTTLVGRAIGELLAHELGHQLLGCDNRGERRLWRCHDRLPHSLMNKGGDRTFFDRTGVVIAPTQYTSFWREDFPAPGTYDDQGVVAVNPLPLDGQAVLDRILPVPPALADEPPCP